MFGSSCVKSSIVLCYNINKLTYLVNLIERYIEEQSLAGNIELFIHIIN